MKRPTLMQAQVIFEALEISPETLAFSENRAELQATLPAIRASDVVVFIEWATGGQIFEKGSIAVTEDVVEGSDLPCSIITIKTEN